MARTVLRTRAAHPDEYLFVIGNMAEVSPINETDPSEKRAHVLDKRRTMEIMTSRHLHRAYTLAENAARGRFPTLDPLPDDPARPKFDFKILLQDLEEHVAWLRREQS